MKNLASIFIFGILAFGFSEISQACTISSSIPGLPNQDNGHVYEVGTAVTYSASGCGAAADAQWFNLDADINTPVFFAGGTLSLSFTSGSGAVAGRRAREIGVISSAPPYAGGSIPFFTGKRPLKPVITAGLCGYSRSLRSNVVKIEIGPDDNDPYPSSIMSYQLNNGSEIIGFDNANAANGRFEADIVMPEGESTLTSSSQRAYRNGLGGGYGDFNIYSVVSDPVVVSCPDLPLDDMTDDGNPDNCPACKAAAGHPVNVSSGKMWHQQKEFTLPGRTEESALVFQRTYIASTQEPSGGLGPHWVHNFESRLKLVQAGGGRLWGAIWIDENGGSNYFDYLGAGAFLSPGGQQTTLKYVSASGLYELKKPDNTILFYTTAGSLRKIKDRHGEEQTFIYTNGKLSSASAPFTGTITFTRDTNGRIITVTRVRDGLSYHYTYDANGNLATATDFANRVYSYEYVANMEGTAAQGLLSKITDPIGRQLTFTYYPNGRAFQQFEPGGGTYTFNYFTNDPLVKAAISKKRHLKTVLPHITHTEVIGPDGAKTSYFFDSNQRTIQTLFADGVSTHNNWNGDGYLTSTVDEVGNFTFFTYDIYGNMLTMKRPGDVGTLGITYDSNFRVPTHVTPPVGSSINFTLNTENGDVTHIDRSDGTNNLALDFTRDGFGRILSTNNGRTTYTDVRDENGFLTTKFNSHNSQTLTYDTRGRVATRTYLSGRVISFTYNDDDQVTLISDSHGPSVSYAYDTMKRKISRTISDGQALQSTTFVWDIKDRLVSEKDALGNTTKYFYDSSKISKNPIRKVDALGRATNYEYDNRNRLVRKVDPSGAVTLFQYNSKGQMAGVTDGLGNITSYNYDANGRKLSELRPSVKTVGEHTTAVGAFITYGYNDSDSLISEVHHSANGGNDRTMLYEYDLNDRLTKKTLKNGADIEDEAVYTYENQLDATLQKTVNNSAVNLGFTHEAAPPFAVSAYSVAGAEEGNPLGILADGFTVSRDGTGNISNIAGSTAGQIYTKAYDPAGRLVGVDAGALKIAMAYDSFGRRSAVSSSDGTSASIQYDGSNRITSMSWMEKYKDSVREALSYNPVGNIVSIDRENASYKLAYDDNDQLASSRFKGVTGLPNYDREFQYDGDGNRLHASPNDMASTYVSNFLVSNGTSSFSADQDGFGQVVHEATEGKTKSYSYRADGKIASFQSSGLSVNYYYDGLGRLAAKAVNDGSNYTQSFVHLINQNRVLIGKAGDNSVTSYIDGQKISERLGEVKASIGKGYITDHLGSVLNSKVAGKGRAFGLFGEVGENLSISSASSPIEYGFAGYQYDQESGVFRTPNRLYNPSVARWLSQDPIGRRGGDENFYRYVGNKPLIHTDPQGLAVGDWWDLPANIQRSLEIAHEESARRPDNHNDLGDALRHSEWQRRTTKETNSFTACMLGTAHELSEEIGSDPQPWNEMMMDLHNNAVGRAAGEDDVPVDLGDLWTAPPDDTYNPYEESYTPLGGWDDSGTTGGADA